MSYPNYYCVVSWEEVMYDAGMCQIYIPPGGLVQDTHIKEYPLPLSIKKKHMKPDNTLILSEEVISKFDVTGTNPRITKISVHKKGDEIILGD